MIAEVKPTPTPPPRGHDDRDRHVYAANASSFLMVLSSVSRSGKQPEAPEASPADRADRAVDPKGSTEAGSSAEKPGGAEKAPENDLGAAANPVIADEAEPDNENEGESLGDLPDAPEPTATGELPAETTSGELMITGESPDLATPSVEAADPLPTHYPASPPVVTTATVANVAQPAVPKDGDITLVPASEDAESDTPLSILDDGTPEDGDTGKQTEKAPAFPKTLNALLAENAVKPRETEVPAARPATAAAFGLSADHDADPKGMPVEESAPLPQTGATELGGVRAAAAPALPRIPLVNLPGEIVQQIHLIGREGTSTMRLRLVPEHLGELRLEIHRTGDTVRVTMISANPLIRDALDSQMAELRKALEQQGLTLSEASVEDQPAPREKGDFESDRPPVRKDSKNNATQLPAPGEQDFVAAGLEALANGGPGGLNILA